MANTDQLKRFLFEETDVRGEIVLLEDSYQRVLLNGDYPNIVSRLLGEVLAAVGLLSATMKFDGILTLQARGDGDISLLMADCSHQNQLRGIAKLQLGAQPDTNELRALLGTGHLAITIDPDQGERYQGIVPLERPTLSSCLEDYFKQSEQLPTRLWLFADGARAGGLLLQALPQQLQTLEARNAYWEHLCVLADTLGAEEFLSTDMDTILVRLFHEERVRLFPAADLRFSCSCSRTRTRNMLVTLGEDEVRAVLAEKGSVDVQCEFCHEKYIFNENQINGLFAPDVKTLH